MGQLQQELETKTVEAQAGGGMVKVVVNGKFEIVSLKIEKDVVNPEDIDMLQDLVSAAVNEGIRKAQEMAAQVVRLVPEILKDKNYPTEKKVIEMALDIPSQIARSHSQRYEDRPGALQRMEEVLQRCDWMIVHLEQIRDIFTGDDGEKAALTEIIRRYGTVRVKIRNLHKAWKRWGEENPSGFSKNYTR